MSRTSFVLLIVIIGVLCGMTAAQLATWSLPWPRRCPPNQQWSFCGTPCPLTCELPFERDCPKQCVTGCECEERYLRKSAQECVSDRSDC